MKVTVSPLLVSATLDNSGKFCNLVQRDALGSLWLTSAGRIVTTNQNLGGYHTSGLDIGVNWTTRMGSSGFGINFVGTYVDKWEFEPIKGNGKFDCVGLVGPQCGTPIPIPGGGTPGAPPIPGLPPIPQLPQGGGTIAILGDPQGAAFALHADTSVAAAKPAAKKAVKKAAKRPKAKAAAKKSRPKPKRTAKKRPAAKKSARRPAAKKRRAAKKRSAAKKRPAAKKRRRR